jgi:hypothetical protein
MGVPKVGGCLRLLTAMAVVIWFGGCSSEEKGTPTSGTLLLDDMPLANASVYYSPVGETPGNGGGGLSDASGKYTVQGARGSGLPPGDYRVVVSRLLRPDGSLPDPNVPPIESDAAETLPTVYTSPESTPLEVKVTQAPVSHQFRLQSKGQGG